MQRSAKREIVGSRAGTCPDASYVAGDVSAYDAYFYTIAWISALLITLVSSFLFPWQWTRIHSVSDVNGTNDSCKEAEANSQRYPNVHPYVDAFLSVYTYTLYKQYRWKNTIVGYRYLLTSMLVKLTYLAKRWSRGELLFVYRWLHVRFDRSRSFKVVDFSANRKPIYTYDLIVISFDLSSRSPRFRDKATRRQLKTTLP